MNVFIYDHTFDGLLTVIFEAYTKRLFPDILLGKDDCMPLFYDHSLQVETDVQKSSRVWLGLQKKLSKQALGIATSVWLSECQGCDMLLFRYLRKLLDTSGKAELNFGDEDILNASRLAKKVLQESHRLIQFLRFKKSFDGIFFAVTEPMYNVLALTIPHFQDRFADQKWLIYDLKRSYGYFYDLHKVVEVSLSVEDTEKLSGCANDYLLDADELFFQKLWQTYFQAISIEARKNLRLHRQNLPVRFWKFLPEKENYER